MNTRETIIDVLRNIASDKRMLNHADYWALICGEAADLLKADADALQNTQEHDSIPIDWLMRWAQMPTEFAIADWRKERKATERERRIRSDKPMTFSEALNAVNLFLPRVLTLEEVQALHNNDVVWLEDKGKPNVIPGIVRNRHLWPHSVVMVTNFMRGDGCKVTAGDDDYGVRWRCWSSCPNNERRNAVAWERNGGCSYE